MIYDELFVLLTGLREQAEGEVVLVPTTFGSEPTTAGKGGRML